MTGVDSRGFIEVDAQRRTAASQSLFAIGDVAGEPMLAHKAFHEARVAVETIAGTQSGLRAAGGARRRVHPTRRSRGVGSPRLRPRRSDGRVRHRGAVSLGSLRPGHHVGIDPDGTTKLVVDPRVRGDPRGWDCRKPAPESSSRRGSSPSRWGPRCPDLTQCIHPHPTLSETMLEAGRVVPGAFHPRVQTQEIDAATLVGLRRLLGLCTDPGLAVREGTVSPAPLPRWAEPSAAWLSRCDPSLLQTPRASSEARCPIARSPKPV